MRPQAIREDETMTKVMVVRNIEQAAAWLEMDGQISDGHWENRRGSDWQTWCAAELRIAREGEELGRQFYTCCDKFNLLDPRLLSVVWKRMIGIVRIARRFGLETAELLEYDVNCDTGRIDWGAPERYKLTEQPGGYYHRKCEKFALLDKAAIDACLEDEFSYTNKDLRRDLKELMQAMRTRVLSEDEKAYRDAQKAARLAEDAARREEIERTEPAVAAFDAIADAYVADQARLELDAALEADLQNNW